MSGFLTRINMQTQSPENLAETKSLAEDLDNLDRLELFRKQYVIYFLYFRMQDRNFVATTSVSEMYDKLEDLQQSQVLEKLDRLKKSLDRKPRKSLKKIVGDLRTHEELRWPVYGIGCWLLMIANTLVTDVPKNPVAYTVNLAATILISMYCVSSGLRFMERVFKK